MLLFKICLGCFFALCSSAPATEDSAAVVEYQNLKIDSSGGSNYDFGTSNGIEAKVDADPDNNVNGEYSYVSPDGEAIKVVYKAGPGIGFQPLEGVHPAIIKAIEYIVDHPPENSKFQRLDVRKNTGGFAIQL